MAGFSDVSLPPFIGFTSLIDSESSSVDLSVASVSAVSAGVTLSTDSSVDVSAAASS